MIKKHIITKRWQIVAVVATVCMLFLQAVPVLAVEESNAWMGKISVELWETMAEKSDEDLIPVYLWLEEIDQEVIRKALVMEKGMDPAVYEDEVRFQEEIVPEIAREIEERVGYEEAHRMVLPEQMKQENAATTEDTPLVTLDENGAFFDDSVSLVDRAISAKADEYLMARRGITKREYSKLNDAFIQVNIDEKHRDIIYNSRYTSTLIVEATKAEIENYAKHKQVEEISLYVAVMDEVDLNVSLGQVGADGSTGTKSSNYNSGSGYRGTGVRIGIIEAAKGVFKSVSPQLKNIYNSRLFLENSAGSNGAIADIVPSHHATRVTGVVVGQSVTAYGVTLEGVAPLAVVYQTPISVVADVLRAIQRLADKTVSIINFSGGTDKGIGYFNDDDREVDRLIISTGVVFVNSAGNLGLGSGNVTSPGNALNAITVGNVNTKSNGTTARTTPYSMFGESSYKEASYLPNKPDISAPGTNIMVYHDNAEPYAASGTSLSAPIVTGIIAQMIQAYPSLKTSYCPSTTVKSRLLLGAEYLKITDTNNFSVGNYLWDKSGAGLVNAVNAVNAARLPTGGGYSSLIYSWAGSLTNPSAINIGLGSLNKGQKIRVVMTYNKANTNGITSVANMDYIGLYLYKTADLSKPNGSFIASSITSRSNVQIIEYTFSASDTYSFRIDPIRLIAASSSRVVQISWRIY